MAYNYPPAPQFYPPMQQTGYNYAQQQQTPIQTNQQNNCIICQYVTGEEAAKSFPVAPGTFAVLLDIDKPVIYTKITDQYGRPQPMKILDYIERNGSKPAETKTEYVTKDDFDSFKNEMRDLIRQRTNYKKPNREEQ